MPMKPQRVVTRMHLFRLGFVLILLNVADCQLGYAHHNFPYFTTGGKQLPDSGACPRPEILWTGMCVAFITHPSF